MHKISHGKHVFRFGFLCIFPICEHPPFLRRLRKHVALAAALIARGKSGILRLELPQIVVDIMCVLVDLDDGNRDV